MVTFGGIKCIEKEKNKKRWFVKPLEGGCLAFHLISSNPQFLQIKT